MTVPADEPATAGSDRGASRALVVILAVAAAVRLAWSAYAARPPVGLHDPTLYRFFGEQIASGHGYTLFDGSPTAYFPVGYPLTLSLGFLVTPVQWNTGVVVAINIAAQLASVALVFAITRRVLDGRLLPAVIASLVVALWPNLIVNSAVALSESLFIALMLGSVLLVLRSLDGGSAAAWRLALIGGVLGLSVLVRPVSPLLLVVFAVAWLVDGVGLRGAAVRVGIIAAAGLVVVSPWLIRNAVVMDAALLSTNTGDNLCMSRRVGASGGFEFPNPRCNSGPFDDLPRPAFETERDAHGRRLAWTFVQEHPLEELRLWFRRLRQTLWSDDDGVAAVESYGADRFLGDDRRRALEVLSNAYYYAAAVAGALGLLLGWRRSATALVVAISPAALLVPVMVTFGDPRFKLPIVPFIAIGVGALVAEGSRGWRSRRLVRRSAGRDV